MRIVWLRQASREFDQHIEYISFRNPTAAAEQDLLISEAIDRLSLYPYSGRVGRRHFTRELVIPHTPFIAIYRIEPDRDEVHILRILHSSQKWPPE
jgi:toxin ParE1/3/4